MTNSIPDLEIIKKVLSDDIQSFEEIVKRYQEKVFSLCISMVGQSNAEDAAQEIFLKIYESLSQFKGESSFSTWVYRVTSNHCLNILSKNKREKMESLEDLVEKKGEVNFSPSVDSSLQKKFEDKYMIQSVL